ncbi:MAG: carbohydrate binding domain-containing protein [Deltaproteobacteria bacterium]|nr:carbohydrate binding domain-containing protein [Deltaproteobacteria bacterium]
MNEGEDTKIFSDDISKMIQVCETEIKGPICGKLAEKSIISISTNSTEDEAEDNSPEIDFPEYLDEQIHYIKNDAVLRELRGIGFYSFNRARGETITWANKLARHYYIDDQNGYFSSDDFHLDYVKNPSFEEGIGSWTMHPGSGGEISVKDITAIDPKLIDEYWTARRRVPHGHKVLDKAQNKLVAVYQNIAAQEVVLPKGAYHLDVYAKKFSSDYEEAQGDVQVNGPKGSSLITYKEKRKINLQSITVDADNPKYDLWTRFRIEFKVPEDNFPVKIILSDNQADVGEITLWDFVELEKLKSGGLTAGVVSFNVKLPAESLNLIGNSGFESGLDNWWTWLVGGTSITASDTAYEGKSGVNILTNGGTSRGAVFKTGSQAIPVTPGEKYALSTWVKTGSIGYAQLFVRFFTSEYGWLNGANDPIKGETIPPNQDWKKYNMAFTVPQKAVYMTPMFFAQGDKGYAYFDSANLVKAANIISLLENRSFEDGADFWQGGGEVKDKPLETGAKALLVQSSSGYSSSGQDLFLQPTFGYKVSGWVYLDNFKKGDGVLIHVRVHTNSDECKDFIVQADNSVQNKWQHVEAAVKINWAYKNNAELLLSAYRPQSDGEASLPLAAYFDDINMEVLDNNYTGAIIEPVPCPSQIEKETEPTDQGQGDQEQTAQEQGVQDTTDTGSAALDEPVVQEPVVQSPLGGQSAPVENEVVVQVPPKVEVAPEEAPVKNGGGGGGGCSLVR